MAVVVKPYARILDPSTDKQGITRLRNIEAHARVSHLSEDRITLDSYDRFLRSITLSHGDFSVIEHEKATVEVVCDRGISHEWVRHRIGSYTQESTRFVNYAKQQGGARFIAPPFKLDTSKAKWAKFAELSELLYMELLSDGETPQLARSVFLTSTKTKLIVTYNLRTWRHFFIMRTCQEAHPQMKELTIPLLEAFQKRIPILFEDIVPNTKQSISMQLLH